MKKTVFVLVVFALLGWRLFAQGSGAQSSSAQGAQNGVIKEISGTVELKKPGASAFTPAKSGDAVTKDTVISTGFKSMALITAGNSTIMVQPLTRLTFSEITAAQGTETLNVNLQSGRIRVDVQPPAGTRANMTVRSPSATASVRGTSFEFDTRTLSVSKGTVAFRGSSGAVMLVNAGSSSRIDQTGRTVDPIETTAAGLIPPAPPGSDAIPSVDAVLLADSSVSVSFSFGQ